VSRFFAAFVAALLAVVMTAAASGPVPLGENPSPVALVRPAVLPLTAMAQLGRAIFFDRRLSSSGRLSCASCHSPRDAYAPIDGGPVEFGGPTLRRQGVRAVPSLMYLERQPNFSIGPDDAENENVNLAQLAMQRNLVPQGGLFWDGRADTLQGQALVPLLNPLEMDGGSVARIARMLRTAPYARRLTQLFGAGIVHETRMLVSEALFAVARYQFEDRSFHPYASKYDAWLEGRARFTPAELRGYRVFNDPKRGNCAACHLDRPTADGLPPLFTDHQYEALGVPRNLALRANRDPRSFDLGICGPVRTDLRTQRAFCGMFATPTLRNVATRHVFFHNGVYHSLQAVLDFYDLRAVAPQRVYPRGADGRVAVLDDLPPRYRRNVDVADPPFDRAPGDRPPMTADEKADVIAFLRTLTDGYSSP
jgi:cytochrome c peroxidase